MDSRFEITQAKLFRALAKHSFPGMLIGAAALEHYGYSRATLDLDLVVPRPEARAVEALVEEALVEEGFTEIQTGSGQASQVEDPETGVKVDILPQGVHVYLNPVPLPEPKLISEEPQYVSLRDLVRIKLGVLLGHGPVEGKDKSKADVGYMIRINGLSVDFLHGSESILVQLFETLWERLHRHKISKEISFEISKSLEDFLL